MGGCWNEMRDETDGGKGTCIIRIKTADIAMY